MKISSFLNEKEIEELQQKFYEYFETGYAFEDFLKKYLMKVGLDEVEVTKRSRDGGIDLKAIRKGIGDFSGIDNTRYYIQAKRLAPKSKVPVQKIRELRGVLPIGYKGMLITTSDFTNDAKREAEIDASRPIITIGGKSLVNSCIDNEIGILFKPFFSKEQLDIFLDKNTGESTAIQTSNVVGIEDYVEKTITANDIRSRIISIPSSIISQFEQQQKTAKVLVNNQKTYQLSIIRGRNYFGGVTQLLKDFGLISSDGVLCPKKSKWMLDSQAKVVKIFIDM